MHDTTEKVIEMPQIYEEVEDFKLNGIFKDIVEMFFEVVISFIPIILYWMIFYLSDMKIDYFEHVKNGSIIWIFLAMLVAGNFKLLTDSHHKNGLVQRLIVGCIIFFMLFLLGIYLILNFATYGLIDIPLAQGNTIRLVVFLGISTVILNVLRIVFFKY
jgi:hypothetical protein